MTADLSKLAAKAELSRFLNGLTTREFFVFYERKLRLDPKPKTLLELGDQLQISKNRVSQVEKEVAQKLRNSLNGGAMPGVELAIEEIRESFGSSVPSEFAFGKMPSLRLDAPTLESREMASDLLLLFLAGPYRWGDDGWLSDNNAIFSLKSISVGIAKGQQCSPDELRIWLVEDGLKKELTTLWIRDHAECRIINDQLVIWNGDTGERAVKALKAMNRPMTRDELLNLIGNERNRKQSLRTTINDDRVIRVNRTSYGLRERYLSD